MKNFKILWGPMKIKLCLLPLLAFIIMMQSCHKNPENMVPKVITVTSDLQGPMGIETDWKGNVWIAETGTANNNGKVVVVQQNNSGHGNITSSVSDAIVHLSSIKNALSREVEGPANLLFDHGKLYILAGDLLYTANVSSFRPGDSPIDAATLPSEDIGSYVRSLNIVTPNDSHPYDLIKGPDGAIYIVDAGANAIIKRSGEGKYSVFAKFPDVKNPTPVPPPMTQSVPTGIIFDGHDFLVSTLTGFPFPEGQAVIYKVSMKGDVSVYKTGFTTLVDIAPARLSNNIVLHFANFGPQGFEPNTGSLLLSAGNSTRTIVDKLNMPSGLKAINERSWYVTSLGDGTLLKITYDY